jgi:hypothetical protein
MVLEARNYCKNQPEFALHRSDALRPSTIRGISQTVIEAVPGCYLNQ